MLNKFRDLKIYENLDFVGDDKRDEKLERQVKERKIGRIKKQCKAARKLSHDLTELKTFEDGKGRDATPEKWQTDFGGHNNETAI
ncbi:hypothetical protein SDJN02_23374, partial [Cucurbita argyrosperma subsp. argyrosperma]